MVLPPTCSLCCSSDEGRVTLPIGLTRTKQRRKAQRRKRERSITAGVKPVLGVETGRGQPVPELEIALVGKNLNDPQEVEFQSELFDVPPIEVERAAYIQLRWTP